MPPLLRSLLAASALAVLPMQVQAASWVLGEALSLPESEVRAAQVENDRLTVGFTPRRSAGSGLESPRLTLSIAPVRDDVAPEGGSFSALGPFDRLERPVRGPERDRATGFAVGGAVSFHDWSLAGSLLQSQSDKAAAQRYGAALGHDGLTARIGFSEVERATRAPVSTYSLGTELAAMPWLSVSADLAVSSTPSASEADTSGLLRFEFSF